MSKLLPQSRPAPPVPMKTYFVVYSNIGEYVGSYRTKIEADAVADRWRGEASEFQCPLQEYNKFFNL